MLLQNQNLIIKYDCTEKWYNNIKSKTLIVWQITRCIFSLKDHGKEGQYSGKAVWMSAGLENREMGIQNGGGKVREKDDHLQSAVSDR